MSVISTSKREWLNTTISQIEQIIRHTAEAQKLEKELENLRHFREIIPQFFETLDAKDQFILHCDDFSAGNMLVDGDYNILGFNDWEFTYAAPQDYQCCMVSWLILSKPYTWRTTDCKRYEEQLEIFLEALRDEETTRPLEFFKGSPRHALSKMIQESWLSGKFWLMLCLRSGLYFNEFWERFENHKTLR